MLQDRLRLVGRRIRELRKTRGMTQARLAELADLSVNYLGKVERGEAQATLKSLFAIADSLQVNSSAFFSPLDRAEITDPELHMDKHEIVRRMRELMDVLADLP